MLDVKDIWYVTPVGVMIHRMRNSDLECHHLIASKFLKSQGNLPETKEKIFFPTNLIQVK